MYLKSLELHGFKSFPEKTVLQFDSGSTVIVGPNGSGKSNITDAMRWVLGELSSRNIRGNRMEDVIFIGADGRKPMSFAEVSVTFDNTGEPRINSPYDEITVTRRYYRAGESEYYINRQPCRLKDIYELFMNTGIGREGYSIIGQGKIAEIISKKSEDRRGIFEETAGISKYRYQKEAAEKRLADTDANVERIMDVFSELEARIPTLEKESAKAKKYLEVYEQKKQTDISLWIYDIERMNKDLEKTEADCRLSAHEMEMISDTENGVEAQSDRIYNLSMENKTKSQGVYEEIRSLRDLLSEADSSRKVLETTIGHLAENKAEEIRKKGRVSENIAEAEKTATVLAGKLREVQNLLSEAENEANEILKEKNGLTEMRRERDQMFQNLQSQLENTEASLTEHRVELSVLQNMLSDHETRTGNMDDEIRAYESKLESLHTEMEGAQESLDLYREKIRKNEDDLKTVSDTIAANDNKSRTIQRDMGILQAKAGALDSRIKALRAFEEQFEGYNHSVKFVMGEAQKKNLNGVRGPLSQLISVPSNYSVAMEAALGNALQNIVVDDEASAKAAISALKRANAGRATFYPISSMRAQGRNAELEAAKKAKGFVGFADELVDTQNDYREIVRYLLGRVAVFGTLDDATPYAKAQSWRVRCVTLDGQQINVGGSFTGGSAKHDSGILSRSSQIGQLETEKAGLEEEVKRLEKELAAVEQANAEASSFLLAENEKNKLIASLAQTEQTHYDGLAAQADVAEQHLIQLRSDASALSDESVRGEADSKRLGAQCEKEESALTELRRKRDEVDTVRKELEVQNEELNTRSAEAQVLLAERKKDLETAEGALEANRVLRQNMQDEVAAHDAEIRRLDEETETAKNEMGASAQKSSDTEALLAEKEALRQQLDDEGMDFEKRLNELRLQLKEIGAKKEIIYKSHTKNENRREQLTIDIDKMTERLWDEYELTHSSAVALGYPPVVYGERANVAQKLTELRNQLRGLGNVNVAAIDEYKEVRERYDAMKVQLDDLEEAKKDILSLIGDIEAEMKTMFVSAFDQINTNFDEVFKELFGGGHAHLTLSDPNDVLNCGIEINVAPPGKMIKSLTLLSGGEQAFVAIALLFALIKVNPSPFCIFDEIEAALDEVNVTRVARYIRRYSKQMQIIMITHRRGTMDIADTLYGVTMPRHGVSKVFTLDINNMSKEEENMLIGDKQPRQ